MNCNFYLHKFTFNAELNDMRDVTNSVPPENGLLDILMTLRHFLKNPLSGMTQLPDWSWKRIILLQLLLAMASGVLAGLIPPNGYHILFGIFFFPVISLTSVTVFSLFFYYFFQVFEKRTVELRPLFTMVMFANIPFFIFQCMVQLLPPVALIGFAFSSLLLIVGLTENFGLSKQKSSRLVAMVAMMILLLWIFNKLT